MRKLLAVLYPSAWARFFRALLGDLRYTPPAWIPASVEGLTESMRRRPATWASLILISGISFVSYHLYEDWWEKHKPRPKPVVQVRQVRGRADLVAAQLGGWVQTATAGSSAPAVAEWQPTDLQVRFDADIAPLMLVGRVVSTGITMEPATPGEWRWVHGSRLRFTPSKPWPPGQKLAITYSSAVSAGAVLPERSWTVQLPELPSISMKGEFYTDPREPETHQGVFTLESELPYALAELEQHLKLEVIGKTALFPKAKSPTEKPYTLTVGNAQGTVFYLRTLPIQIPEKEDWLKLSLSAGLRSTHGGMAQKEEISARIRVPDASSGFSFTDFRADIVHTEEGDPEQTLFIQTSGYVRGEELEKFLSAWVLPTDKPADEHGPAVPFFQWGNPIFYTPQVMAMAKRMPLKRVETEKDEGAPMTTLHAFKLPPSAPMKLMVKVESGLKALGGFGLTKPHFTLVDLPQLTREITIDSGGGLLALNGERKLSVKYRGVGHLRFTLARVPFSQLNHLARLTDGDFQSPYWKTDFDEENVARISREVRQVALQNEYAAHYTSYDFQTALSSQDSNDPDASRGLFFLTVEGVEKRKDKPEEEEAKTAPELRDWLPLEEELKEQRFVLITDLGVVLKRNADLTADVFVQSVVKGEPVANAQIMVLAKNGEFLTQTQTDAQGHAVLPDLTHHRREKLPVCVVARLGNDVAFLPFQRPDRLLDFSRFDTGGVLASQRRALDGFLFTERGIYRPGDAVHVSGIVKRRDWAGEVVGLPMKLEVRDAKNDMIIEQRLQLPEDGFFDLTVPTSEASVTGTYSARLYLDLKALKQVDEEDESGSLLGVTRFRVEDFQPDRMKMRLQFDQPLTEGWIKPGDLKATVHVQTLFDAPAAQRRVQAKLMLDPGAFSFPVHQDYAFHNPLTAVELHRYGQADASAGSGRSVSLGEVKTNDAGDAVFDLGLQRFSEGVFSMDLMAEAYEADGGRSVRTQRTLLVAPQDYVVGWKADGDLGYIGKDVPRVVQWLALSPTLQPVAVEGLQQRLVQQRYVSVLTRQESGSYAYVSTLREDVLSSSALALPASGAQLALPTGKPGEYRLELVNAQQQVVCVTPFSVVGEGDSSRSMERDAELQLKLQKDELAAGEPLQLSLRAPFTGAGLVTIEREKVLSWHWIKQTTLDATHSIPLPADLEGTAYVNVTFVRALDSPEVFTSPLSYAVAPFRCQVDKRKLSVKLDAPARVKPGETVRMGYQSATPGRVVVYAVDEGILQVTDYKLPAPLTHFDRKRALEVESEQLLDLIIPEFSLLTKNKAYGGSEDLRVKLRLNPFKRRREAPVVYWSGILDCGPERKELSYTVPDYFNGSLRIMAVAVSSAGIGNAELSTVVKGPLILTPNAPFHAAPGDSFTASLNVVNQTEGSTASSDLVIQASSSEHLQITGEKQLRISLAPGKETTLRFPIQVQPRLGGAELSWTVSTGSGGETSTRSTTLSVRPAVPFSTQLQSGYWRTAQHEVPVKRQMHMDHRQLEATVSTTPLSLARGLEAYLAAYPHGCSEQITSRAMSKLLLAEEVDFGMDKAQAVQQLDYTFSVLRVRQNTNGGFGYWGDDCSGEPEFLSLYVTSFLTEAKDAGYAVPADLLRGARERLKQMARHKTRSLAEADLQAQAIYLLTRQGEVTTNALLMLRDLLDSGYKDAWAHRICAAYLASTYMLLKQEKEAEALMSMHRSKCDSEPKFTRWYGGWWQDPRVEDAQRFALLCRHFPEVAGDFGYDELRVITEPMSRGFINTISSAQTILALKSYATLAKQSAVTVSVSELLRSGGQPSLLSVPRSGLTRTSFSPEAGLLRFHLDQQGTDLGAFYQTLEAGFDLQPSAQAVSEGFEVFRELVDDADKPITELKVGQGVKLRIRLRNISPDHQSYIALTDLMPGGFEIENGSLRPGLSTLPGAEYVDVREDRNILYTGLAKGESISFSYRIKPIAAGSFIVPSVYAESMYDPSYRGLSAVSKITVKPAE